MKIFKFIATASAMTVFAAACAKHGIPNYYDAQGHQIPFSQYKAIMKCKSPYGFNVNNEVAFTTNKFSASKSYFILTYLVSDSQSLANPNAPVKAGKAQADQQTDDAKTVAQLLKQQDNFVADYPAMRTVSDNSHSTADNIVMDQDCDQNEATYSGPGVTGKVPGAITDMALNDIEINGVQSESPHQKVDVKVERLITDGTVKGQKGTWYLQKNRDSNGFYQFKITLTKQSPIGTRTVVFRQDVVDDVTTTVNVSADLLQEYLQGVSSSGDAALSIGDALKHVKSDKTVDVDVRVLMAARDEIASKQNAPAPAPAQPSQPDQPAQPQPPAQSQPQQPPTQTQPAAPVAQPPAAGTTAAATGSAVDQAPPPGAPPPAQAPTATTPAATTPAVGTDPAKATPAESTGPVAPAATTPTTKT